MKLAIVFFIGIVIGALVASLIFGLKFMGTLFVGDDGYLFLEMSKGPHSLSNKKHVVFKVDNETFMNERE